MQNRGNDLSMDDGINKFAIQIKRINEVAYIQYKPIAYDLCSRVAPISEVEHTLDRMLDFCGCDEVLSLFKKICKHYYEIYPEMITFEINSYREFWDSE